MNQAGEARGLVKMQIDSVSPAAKLTSRDTINAAWFLVPPQCSERCTRSTRSTLHVSSRTSSRYCCLGRVRLSSP